jgi:hypothetical protein
VTSSSNPTAPVAGEPWSIFQQGGGQGAAATWADDLLREIGAPLNQGNEQFIYDWEVSEGGGGWYNPLNQGDDPSNPSLTSTGSQYGGGAANYNNWNAGLKGSKDYLAMPDYSQIAVDLKSSDPTSARTDLIQSPWAGSHYDWGAGFSNAPLPGKKSVLKGSGPIDANTTSVVSGLTGAGNLISDLGSADFWERAGLIIFGAILIIVGIIILALPGATKAASVVGSTSRSLTAAGNLIGSGGSGGPTDEEREDRSRRLALAERNTDIGAKKVEIQGMREARLAGPRAHKSGTEPNPNPAHS